MTHPPFYFHKRNPKNETQRATLLRRRIEGGEKTFEKVSLATSTAIVKEKGVGVKQARHRLALEAASQWLLH